MHEVLNVLVRLMAPVLSFTSDEIWQYMIDAEMAPSVHAELFIPVKEEYRNTELAERWEEIIKVRKEVTRALEIARKEKMIGHPLDAAVTLGLSPQLEDLLEPYKEQLQSIFIVSSVRILSETEVDDCFESEEVKGFKVKVVSSEDPKCERCWVHDPTVGEDSEHPTICNRCRDALAEMEYLKE